MNGSQRLLTRVLVIIDCYLMGNGAASTTAFAGGHHALPFINLSYPRIQISYLTHYLINFDILPMFFFLKKIIQFCKILYIKWMASPYIKRVF